MDTLFGRVVKRETITRNMLAVGVQVTTTIRTENNKHIVLFTDGTMLTTCQPTVVMIEQNVEFIPEDQLMDLMDRLDNNVSVDEFLMKRVLNQFK